MSELKAYNVVVSNETENYINGETNLAFDAYDADEVDTLLAKKDEIIDELKEHIDELQKATDSAWSKVNAIYDELRHHKYNRCLAMAKWCFEKSYSTTLVKYDKESGLLRNFYDWWGKRWLELAKEPTWAKFLQLIHKEEK